MSFELIVTHPGSAHFDEVTAISLLTAVYPRTEFKIERRPPTVAELENPDIWVIDTGHRLEPEKHNFDHHQSLECPASFVLMADYLKLTDSLSLLPWWNFKDYVDREGPFKASQRFQAGDDLVNRNPVEDWLTGYFADDPQGSIAVLKDFGANLISQARTLKTQIETLKKARKLVIKGVPAIISRTRESFGLEEFRRLEPDPPAIVISLDRRSDGWRLFRYDDTPVDFRKIAGDDRVEFAHMSGFLAKTREPISEAELVELIGRAITG